MVSNVIPTELVLDKAQAWSKRFQARSVINEIKKLHGENLSFFETMQILLTDPFRSAKKISFYTFFGAYADFLKDDYERLTLMSEMQRMLGFAEVVDHPVLVGLYDEETKKYREIHERALRVFSSVRLTRPIESIAGFVSKRQPKISLIS